MGKEDLRVFSFEVKTSGKNRQRGFFFVTQWQNIFVNP
jgi:hypothetical protein